MKEEEINEVITKVHSDMFGSAEPTDVAVWEREFGQKIAKKILQKEKMKSEQEIREKIEELRLTPDLKFHKWEMNTDMRRFLSINALEWVLGEI